MSDQILSNAQLRKAFGSSSARYTAVDQAPDDWRPKVGSSIRIVLYNEPSFWDHWNDSAQDNAEEHTQEILDELGRNGIVAFADRVQGVDLATYGWTQGGSVERREAYCYDLTVTALVSPSDEIVQFPDPTAMVGSTAMVESAAASYLRTIASSRLLTGLSLVGVLVVGSGVTAGVIASSGGTFEGIAFWLAVGVAFASVAYIYGKAKG